MELTTEEMEKLKPDLLTACLTDAADLQEQANHTAAARLIRLSVKHLVAQEEALKQAAAGLESAWLVVFCHASNSWGTLDEIEEAIGAITGETDVQVNQRLYKEHKRFIRNWRAGCIDNDGRLRAREKLTKYRAACEAIIPLLNAELDAVESWQAEADMLRNALAFDKGEPHGPDPQANPQPRPADPTGLDSGAGI